MSSIEDNNFYYSSNWSEKNLIANYCTNIWREKYFNKFRSCRAHSMVLLLLLSPVHTTQHPIIPAQSKLHLVVIPTMKFLVQFQIGIPSWVFSFNWKWPLSVANRHRIRSIIIACQPNHLTCLSRNHHHRIVSCLPGQFQWNDKFSSAPNSAIHVSNPNCSPHILLPQIGWHHSPWHKRPKRFLWNNNK